MSITRADLEVIHRNRIADVEQTFDEGLRLYRFEWRIGSIAVGFITFAMFALILFLQDPGSPKNLSIASIIAVAIIGIISQVIVGSLVRRWSRQLLDSTNEARELAYRRHIEEVETEIGG